MKIEGLHRKPSFFAHEGGIGLVEVGISKP